MTVVTHGLVVTEEIIILMVQVLIALYIPLTPLDKVKNLKHVIFGTYSNTGMVMFYKTMVNLFHTTTITLLHTPPGEKKKKNSSGEDGTYKPTHCYIIAGTKIKWFWLGWNVPIQLFWTSSNVYYRKWYKNHWGFSGYPNKWFWIPSQTPAMGILQKLVVPLVQGGVIQIDKYI